MLEECGDKNFSNCAYAELNQDVQKISSEPFKPRQRGMLGDDHTRYAFEDALSPTLCSKKDRAVDATERAANALKNN